MSATVYDHNVTIYRPPFIGKNEWWQIRDLRPITVLFGKNGSGKSVLLRSWRNKEVENSHYIVPERTGNLDFEASYLGIQTNPKSREGQSGYNFLHQYRQHIITRIQAYFLARGSVRSDQLPGNIEELEKLLTFFISDFDIELVGTQPGYRIWRSENRQQIDKVDQLSSGEAQILTLGLDILTMAAIWDIQRSPKRLMLIDEPDVHIHPDLQVRFSDFLIQVANRFSLQVVVATHSTTLLSALGQFAGDDCGVIYLDRTKTEFHAQIFTSSLNEVAACLGGHALMGPLFGVPLLLVEGDDDYRVWSQIPRHHQVSFAVIPCNGSKIEAYQKSLETIFSSLRDTTDQPAGYALRDGDKPLPQPNPDVPQDHVRYMRLNCHETENMYLTDEVLALIGTTWTDAITSIVAASEKHGNKAAMLANAANWDRQTEDVKSVINEISAAIDPKNVHWTQRVGTAIGRAKPTGQLAEFLGSGVINSLWR